MALAYLLDENERGVLWRALQRHNSFGVNPIDVLRVGDFSELPLGSKDPAILLWAEANNRILISRDERTLKNISPIIFRLGGIPRAFFCFVTRRVFTTS